MSPIKAVIALAALLVTSNSAMPMELHERYTESCPSGSFRMKLYSRNSNGQMVWNGQYVANGGGPLEVTSTASAAMSFYVDNNKNLIESDDAFAACVSTIPHYDQPINTTIVLTKSNCQANNFPMVECIQTPQYNECWAGSNQVVQQCGKYILLNSEQISSAGGASCGPVLDFFIDKC